LENNTRLIRCGDDYAVVLHSTAVVTIHQDGTYTLRTGGWRTVTTKDRINKYSPARVYSTNGNGTSTAQTSLTACASMLLGASALLPWRRPNMFQIIYQGPHGDTVESGNPKLDAYKQAAYIVRMGRTYTITSHDDGSYTVTGDGLQPITFERPT